MLAFLISAFIVCSIGALAQENKGMKLYIRDFYNDTMQDLENYKCWDGSGVLLLAAALTEESSPGSWQSDWPIHVSLMFQFPGGNGGSIGASGDGDLVSKDSVWTYVDGIPQGQGEFESITFTAQEKSKPVEVVYFSHKFFLLKAGQICPGNGLVLSTTPSLSPASQHPNTIGFFSIYLTSDSEHHTDKPLQHLGCWDGKKFLNFGIDTKVTGVYPVKLAVSFNDIAGNKLPGGAITGQMEKEGDSISLEPIVPSGAATFTVQGSSTNSSMPPELFWFESTVNLESQADGKCQDLDGAVGGGGLYRGTDKLF